MTIRYLLDTNHLSDAPGTEMIRELLRDFDGSWKTIAAMMAVAAILLRILAWVCLLVAHYFAPTGRLSRLDSWLAWSAYAIMLISVIIFIATA